jgi:hypothetical protein
MVKSSMVNNQAEWLQIKKKKRSDTTLKKREKKN